MNSASCGDCCKGNKVLTEQANIEKRSIPQNPNFAERIYPTVEIISRLALGALAAILNPVIFMASAGTGFVIGVAYTLYKNIKKEPIEKGNLISSCATGFCEQLSGHRFPKVILLVVTSVFISIHYHHPAFVGFCMVPWGMFVGSSLTQAAWNLTYREIYPLKSPPIKSIGDIFTQFPTTVEVS